MPRVVGALRREVAPRALNEARILDRAVRPGAAFYQYANGQWLRSARIPDDRSSYSVRSALYDRTAERSREIIETASGPPGSGALRAWWTPDDAHPAGVSRWPLASIALAACYSPSVPLGAPCNPGDACPDGQACIASKCVIAPTGGVDAAAMPGDRDGDGVSDLADNCADVANADQANEDGDTFGDACDPCPPVADSAPAVDTDGDGVADACDPNPQVPGDKIALFEGFHHGVPSWARSLHWTAATDAVRVASPNDSTVEFLVLPIADLDRITLSAQVVIEQTIPGGDDDIDLVVPEDVNNDEGVDCELYEPPGGMANRQLALFDDLKNGGDDLSSTLLAWTNNTAYKLVLTRRGTSFTCSAAGTAAPLLLGTSTTKGGTDPAAVIRAYGLTARVDWVMVVRSP